MSSLDALEQQLAQASEDEAAWPQLMAAIADHFGAVEATLGGGFSPAQMRMVAPRTDPARISQYVEQFHDQNTLMHAFLSRPPGTVTLDEDMPLIEHFRRGTFYNEWCLPQDFRYGMGTSFSTLSGWTGALMLNSTRQLERGDAALLEAMLPRIGRAIESGALASQVRASQKSMLDMLDLAGQGALLLDRRGQVIDFNLAAQAVLRGGSLALREGRLSTGLPHTDRTLNAMVDSCIQAPDAMRGGRLEIPTAYGGLVLNCTPYPSGVQMPSMRRPAMMIMVTDPQLRLRQRLEAMQKQFGLTLAETGLIAALVQAGDRKGAADRRGVTVATARAQLTSIFDKVGVRRQTELMRLVLGE